MGKKKTSISIDEDLWQQLRIHCLKEKTDTSKYLEKLISKDLKLAK